jgi:ribosomal protein S18 acetylase RimI-like enzyme
MTGIDISPARSLEDVEACRAIFVDYARSLGFSIAYQGFEAEMAGLPGDYAVPAGALLLARVDGAAAGAVGLRPLADPEQKLSLCEMKHLYVRPDFRGLKLGRQLTEAVIAAGEAIGYDAMRLDTVEAMVAARALYSSLGFVTIPPYFSSPLDGAMFYQLALT